MSRRSKKENANNEQHQTSNPNGSHHSTNGKPFKAVEAKTEGQQRYIDAIKNNSIVFCYGPNGSGKGTVAIGCAIEALRRKQIQHIVLTRPLIDACNDVIGTLGGDMHDKVWPYYTPLLEAIEQYASSKEVEEWINDGTIEILPLGYARGRNLHRSYVVCDESQNMTFEQFKLMLSRIGRESTMIFCGDLKQSDLPKHKRGAFLDICNILKDLDFVAKVELTKADIIRSPLIAKIFDKIEEWENIQEKSLGNSGPYGK